MQITINTDTDDLPAVIRMLQAYAPPRKLRMTNEATGETIAEFTPSTVKITNEPIEVTEEQRREFNARQTAAPPGEQGRTPPCSAHAQEDDEPAPKSLFDAPQPNAPDDPIQPPPHSDVTVDAAGLPWDARIHSGAKSKLANGNWKLLRGVDPALVASVEAELRGDPTPAAPATVPVAPPAAPNSPPAPPAPPTPPAPKPITNAAELVAAVMDKRFTTDQVNEACRAVGVDNVASLLAKQDKLPDVLRHLGVPA